MSEYKLVIRVDAKVKLVRVQREAIREHISDLLGHLHEEHAHGEPRIPELQVVYTKLLEVTDE